jgi:tripartite-type tricarboxylate transporter receptor subunit TctC
MKVAVRIAAAMLLLVAIPAFAQPYPTRAIRFIVPVPPGGGADAVARKAKITHAAGITPE